MLVHSSKCGVVIFSLLLFVLNVSACSDITFVASTYFGDICSSSNVTIGASVYGNVSAVTDIILGGSSIVFGQLQAGAAITTLESGSIFVSGNISAVTSIDLGGSSTVIGSIQAGQDIYIGASSIVTGQLQAGTTITLGSLCFVGTNIYAGGNIDIGASCCVNGTVVSDTGIVSFGGGVNIEGGDCFISVSIPTTISTTTTSPPTSTTTTSESTTFTTPTSTAISTATSTATSTSSLSTSSSTIIITTPTPTTNTIPPTKGSTTNTLPPTSTLSTPPTSSTTTSTTTHPNPDFFDICSGKDCTDLIFPDPRPSSPSNTTFVVGNNTVSVDTFGNSSRFTYNYSWGDIYEADSSLSHQVKGIDLSLLTWDRSTFSNLTHVVVSFQATANYDQWTTHPIAITFEATFSWQDSLTQNLKTSISIVGDWQFEQPSNTLHMGLVLIGEFGTDRCGRNTRLLNSTAQSLLYELYSPNNTITRLELLKYCHIDGDTSPQPAFITAPSLSNQTIIVNATFPSFKQRLDYDPNMAVLLSAGMDDCSDSILVWILPVGFLAGAGVVIIVVSILGTTPWLAPYILGYEAVRVHKLRNFVKENNDEISNGNERPVTERLESADQW